MWGRRRHPPVSGAHTHTQAARHLQFDALSASFGLSPYDTTYSPNLIPDASFARRMSHLLRNRIRSVRLSSGFETIDFHRRTESSWRARAGVSMQLSVIRWGSALGG